MLWVSGLQERTVCPSVNPMAPPKNRLRNRRMGGPLSSNTPSIRRAFAPHGARMASTAIPNRVLGIVHNVPRASNILCNGGFNRLHDNRPCQATTDCKRFRLVWSDGYAPLSAEALGGTRFRGKLVQAVAPSYIRFLACLNAGWHVTPSQPGLAKTPSIGE